MGRVGSDWSLGFYSGSIIPVCVALLLQAGKIVELHSKEEIGRPFGPPLPRSAD